MSATSLSALGREASQTDTGETITDPLTTNDTIAERILGLLNSTAPSRPRHEVCEDFDPDMAWCAPGRMRWFFRDGSAVALEHAMGYTDVACATCWQARADGHAEGCPDAGECAP